MSSSTPTLINIGTHSLALYTHGPELRSSKDPVVLFIAGVESTSRVWAAVTRLLPRSLRSYNYDRSGYGNSELSPLAPTAENIALELSYLIKRASISNPLILVGHSWAGVLINEFIALTENGPHIAGVVFVDANHETALQVLNPNDANLQAISEGVDFFSGIGVRSEHKFTSEEWDAFEGEGGTEKYLLQAKKEDDEYAPSFETLLKKELRKKQPLLGDKPVYVIGGLRSRDWSGLYKAGIERGNGTEEQKNHVRNLIESADKKSEGLMKEHLKLSTRGKLVFADKSGHFILVTQPNMVVDGVKWVVGELQTS
ncbi:hypothetical protein EAE96_004855 [Botrytis aclada]|nr:hypothetical protein EAE96_004855 [Botrytis aclada]